MSIVLYGATGYTGRLVTDELVRRGLDFTLSGRSRDKLVRVAEERGRGAPVVSAAADDERALERLLTDADVVINCAGPFTLAGDALVRTAVRTGTHYVDSTGEQPYMRMVFDELGDEAERAGVALVPAMGFDYVPGDCIARLAARGLEPLERLTLAYSVQGFGMSRGTLKSGLEMMQGGDVVYTDGDWRPAGSGVYRASFDFPEPIGRQAMLRYPSGEQITVPRHTRTRSVVSLLTASTAAPNAALARALPFAQPGLALALRTPLRGLMSKAVGALPEGPPEESRRGARFTIVAVARGEDGQERCGVVRGEDIYGLTAVTLAYAAEHMSESGYGARGALGPAAAFDPEDLLEHLGAHRLSWELAPATVAR